MSEAMVRITGLRKRFGQHEVLCGIDMEVESGSTVALSDRADGRRRCCAANHLETRHREPSRSTASLVAGPDASPAKARFNCGVRRSVWRSSGSPVSASHRARQCHGGSPVARSAGEARAGVGHARPRCLSAKFDSYPPSSAAGSSSASPSRPSSCSQVMLFDEATSALDPELVEEASPSCANWRRGSDDDRGDA